MSNVVAIRPVAPTLNTYKMTFVLVASPKKSVVIEEQDECLSFAYPRAMIRARAELGGEVVLKQDHKFYKK